MLRIPRETLQELAAEFPDDIGVMLRDLGRTGRRNMARMRWHMVWGKVPCPLDPLCRMCAKELPHAARVRV